MKKLTKEQHTLLEHALDNLYDFLKNMYKVDYSGCNIFSVYKKTIRVQQCSIPPGRAWYADIILEDRRIYLVIRKAERETICSEREYDLIYFGTKTKIHTICF